jgi:hypothetical protein
LSCRARRLALRFMSGVLGVLWFDIGSWDRLPKSIGSCTPGVPKHRQRESNRPCIVKTVLELGMTGKLETFHTRLVNRKKLQRVRLVSLPNRCTTDGFSGRRSNEPSIEKRCLYTTEMKNTPSIIRSISILDLQQMTPYF